MQYGLTWNGREQTVFFAISADQYADLLKIQEKIAHASYLEQKFNYILENFRDYAIAMLNYGKHRSENDIDAYNRRLMNLLTTTKSYTDGVPQHAKCVLGSDPEVVERVAKLTRKEHSERLGYRIMYELRNYAQHRGLPLHSVHCAPHTSFEELTSSIDFYISVEKLEEDHTFKKSVLKEIRALGSVVGIKKFLYEFIEGLWTVHQQLRDMFQPTIDEAYTLQQSLLTSFFSKFPPDASSRVVHLVTRDARGFTTSEWEFPKRLEAFARIRGKTSSLQEHGIGWLFDQ